jgi:hypothetical protein
MRDVYATSLTLGTPEAAQAAFDAGIAAARDWSQRKLGSGLPEGDSGRVGSTAGTAEWFSAASPDRDRQLWQIVVRDASRDDATLIWRTSAQVALTGAGARATVRVAVESSDPRVVPFHYEFRRPDLVRLLVEGPGAWADQRRLDRRATRIDSTTVHGLADLILDPGRRLPVVVLTPEDATTRPAVDADALADRLLGLAHVFDVTVNPVTFTLTDRVGQLRSVFRGAVRLYWPGFTLESWPYDHPLWFPDRIHALASVGRPLDQHLQAMLTAVAVLRVPPDPLARELRLAQDEAARQRTDEAVAALVERARTEAGEAWFADLEHIDARRRILEDEVVALRDENEELREENAQILENMRVIAMARGTQGIADQTGEEDEDAPPTSVLDAVKSARRRGRRIVILDEALASAGVSRYRQPDKVLDALMTLDDLADAWDRDALPGGFRGFLEDRGFLRRYRDDVDPGVVNKHPGSYIRSFEGQQHVIGRHFELGKGTTAENVCRIHWFELEDRKTFVVGHVGEHLPDSTT